MAPKGQTLSAESRAKITGRPISSSAPGTIHKWLRTHHPKANVCEECGKVGRTDYAYLFHPQPHTRDRNDYRELCRKCHRTMDDAIYKWSDQLGRIQAGLSHEELSERGRRGAEARWGAR